MRLTKPTDDRKNTTIGTPKAIACYWKLKNYEDIEEKLGIAFEALSEVILSNEAYIIEAYDIETKKTTKINHVCFVRLYTYEKKSKTDRFLKGETVLDFDFLEKDEEGNLRFHRKAVRLKDFGKTWYIRKKKLL